MNRGPMLGAPIAEFHVGTHGRKQIARGLNVAYLRDILENHRLIREQGGRHAGKRGILRPADAHRSEQRLPAAYYKYIHEGFLGSIVTGIGIADRDSEGTDVQ